MADAMNHKKIIVIGCGRLGSNLATKLSLEGEDIVIIDEEATSFRKLDENFSGYQMQGNGADISTLEKAGIEDAKMLIVTTDDDSTNIFISQMAFNIFKIRQIFARLNDVDKAVLLENTNIKGIFPFELSMKEFERIRREE